MLGEKHTLSHDFPEFDDVIEHLLSHNNTFQKEHKRYNALDREIRTLELNNGPIEDLAMQQLKQSRAELKDHLYRQLQQHRH